MKIKTVIKTLCLAIWNKVTDWLSSNYHSFMVWVDNQLMKKKFYIFLTLIFIGSAGIMFFWHKKPNFDFTLDHSLWGTYGDFVGGVLGTIFMMITVLLMIKTFGQQRKDYEDNDKKQRNITTQTRRFYKKQNENNIQSQQKLNEEIRFNSLFFEMLRLYQQQVSFLYLAENKEIQGKLCFNSWVEKLSSTKIKGTNREHIDKEIAESFMCFYVENQTLISSIYRTLYRIFDTVNYSLIDEDKKVGYIKIVRAQLSESEMFLLRYNAQTYYGRNFIEYINKYNLLKHIPIFSLLEFNPWRVKVKGTEITAINILLNESLRFFTKYDAETENPNFYIGSDTSKYALCSLYPSPFRIELRLYEYKDKTDDFRGLNVFDKFESIEKQSLLQRFFEYLIFDSNFNQYNEEDKIDIQSKKEETDTAFSWCVSANSILGDRRIQLKY